MKIHKPLLYAIVDVLEDVFTEKKMADKAIQKVLKSEARYGSRDRAFIASNSYNIVRWWRLLHFINGSDMHNYTKENLWQILGIQLTMNGEDLPSMKQFGGITREHVVAKFEEAQRNRKVRESIPDWLDDIGERELGESWDNELSAMNEEAKVGIRVNTLKTNLEELQIILQKDGIHTDRIKGVETGLYLKERKNIFGTKAFSSGYFEVQDPGSQLIGAYLDVKPDMRVIDACAGAGGKSLHIANQMNNKGTLIALDTEEWKLKELKKRAKRNGLHNIDTRPIVNNKVIKRLKESADRLLLDVPCSGTGVLRRNPDAKWKLDQSFLDRIRATQKEIILNYSRMVKPGGKMVYATCSILPSENQDQVQWFLTKSDEFDLISEHRTSPHKDGFDGFYMALLQRKFTEAKQAT